MGLWYKLCNIGTYTSEHSTFCVSSCYLMVRKSLIDIMKTRNFKFLAILIIAATAFASFKYFEGNKKRESIINYMVYDALSTAHFSSKEFDDTLSAHVFEDYIDALDYGKRYLIQGDVESFQQHRYMMDDYIKSSNMVFFDQTQEVIQKRIKESEKYYSHWLSRPFDFDLEESLEVDAEKMAYATDTKALKDFWRKWLKYRVQSRVYDKLKDNDSLSFKEAEEWARNKELEYQDDLYEYITDMERIEWLGVYMNAFTAYFDPHTNYFAPKIKDRWEEDMTGQFEGIGAQLRVKGEYITVEKIIAGSASWRQGELQAGDKILAVAQGSEEPVDVVGMKLDKVVKQIRGKKGTEVRLTVKKKDGSKEVIPIIRDIVEMDQTFARSAILGEDKSVGYIRLPKFYVDFYSKNNHNAARDVKEEIISLKGEGVDGIILDLRNNGGGSLKAAIDIAGLFVESGPIVQVKNSFGSTKVHRDHDPKVYFDGPLVILVNDFSASASEILAAAMQDYGRAIIVGSKTTFGKGTVQNIFDMDKAAGAEYSDVKPLGAVKVTTEKFYRISGGTTQLVGVTPDIIIPNMYNEMDMGEKEEKNALPFDEIEPANFVVWENNKYFKSVEEASALRIAENQKFQKTLAYSKWLKENQDITVQSLQYESYRTEQEAYELQLKDFDEDEENKDSLAVHSLVKHQTLFDSDSTKVPQYNTWFKNLSKDANLKETVHVLYDMIEAEGDQ